MPRLILLDQVGQAFDIAQIGGREVVARLTVDEPDDVQTHLFLAGHRSGEPAGSGPCPDDNGGLGTLSGPPEDPHHAEDDEAGEQEQSGREQSGVQEGVGHPPRPDRDEGGGDRAGADRRDDLVEVLSGRADQSPLPGVATGQQQPGHDHEGQRGAIPEIENPQHDDQGGQIGDGERHVAKHDQGRVDTFGRGARARAARSAVAAVAELDSMVLNAARLATSPRPNLPPQHNTR